MVNHICSFQSQCEINLIFAFEQDCEILVCENAQSYGVIVLYHSIGL